MKNPFRVIGFALVALGLLVLIGGIGLLVYISVVPGRENGTYVALIVTFINVGALAAVAGGALAAVSRGAGKEEGLPRISTVGTLISVTPAEELSVDANSELVLSIEITTFTGERIIGEVRAWFPPTEVPKLRPGMRIPVRYNAKKPKDLVLDSEEK